MKKTLVVIVVVLALCSSPLVLCSYAQTSYTWSKGAAGNWSESGSWTPNGVPGPGDSATIDTPYQVTLSATTTVGSLTVKNSGASLLCSGNITLDITGNLDVLNSGVVYVQPSGAPTDTYLKISVGGNATIASTSSIEGSARGYASRYGPASATNLTATLNTSTSLAGKDAGDSFEGGGGGSHCGVGGYGDGGNPGGQSYGNALAPITMGSGGGRGQGTSGSWVSGGAGGGALWLDVAGTLNLNGAIRMNGANGLSSSYRGGGGGGGGTIRITVAGALSGTGSLSANGGTGGGSADGGGGGGGGRIYMVYGSGAYALASVTANGGANTGGSSTDGNGGSIWIQDQKSTPSGETDDDIRAGGGVTQSGDRQYAILRVVAVTNGAGVSSGSLTFSNSLLTNTTTVYTNGNLTVLGTATINGTLTVNGSASYRSNTSASVVNVTGGTLDLRNNITLSVSGTMNVTAGGKVTCRPVGAATDTFVTLSISGALNVDATSSISMDGFGYPAQYGPASSTNLVSTLNTSTSYAGKCADSSYEGGGGGSGGGNGGMGNDGPAGGLAFGDGLAPITMGSGGGRGMKTTGTWVAGGPGGGAIYIVTGTLTLNGSITAHGGAGATNTYSGGGGGAGGSVRVSTVTLGGSGSISANGGAGGGSADGGGGGGGGRVALTFDQGTYALTVTANGGPNSGGSSVDGKGGSIWIQDRRGTPGDETDDVIRAGGNVTLSGNKQYATLTVLTVTDGGGLAGGSLTFQNNLTVTTLTIQNAGDLTVQGTLSVQTVTGNGNLTVESDTTLSTFTQNGGTLTLKNNIRFEVLGLMHLKGNATVNVKPVGTATVSCVRVVAANFILESGSKISGTGFGYPARYGPASATNFTATLNTNTLYAGQEAQAGNGGGGGGHGGDGGRGDGSGSSTPGGKMYGDPLQACEMGSGGGRGATAASTAQPGAGGAALLLEVSGTATINGTIEMNGTDGQYYSTVGGGGGGGGSFYGKMTQLTGSGQICAEGGDGGGYCIHGGGGGSGGRITVYAECIEGSITYCVEGGLRGTLGAGDGAPGTVHEYEWCKPFLTTQTREPQLNNRTTLDPKHPAPDGGNPVPGPEPQFPTTEELKLYPGGIIPLIGCPVPNANPWTSIGTGLSYTIGEPVYGHSGEFQRAETDLSIPGRGMSFSFQRLYRSQVTTTGPLGWNWDHNYNIRLEVIDATSVTIYNGFARRELYNNFDSGTGLYATPGGYFNTLKKNGDGTYTLTERNGTRTTFNSAGRMTRLEDRNANALTFEVDPDGRLQYIKDSLFQTGGSPERKIEFVYVPNTFFIQKIRDWKGREVLYAYYGDNEPGGNPWDLKSVTTPATPDQPNGSTISYTYSKGNNDNTLNHNLLTVRNPNQQPAGADVIANTYNSSDQVTAQAYGTASYVFAYGTSTTDETDRNGNLRRVYFNKDGVAGNADDSVTWKIEQFTRGIRPGDPAGFVTLFDHNTQGNLSKVTFPRGNSLSMAYDDANPDPLQRGNVLSIRRADEALGNDPDLVTSFTYYPSSQFSLVESITDPKGNITQFFYDTAGNLTRLVAPSPTTYDTNGNPTGSQTVESSFTYNGFGQVLTSTNPIGKVSSFTYYPTGTASFGYLQQVTVDSSGTNLTASFEYDTVGNLTRVTDGRGNATTFEYNDLDQLTKSTSVSPFAYVKEYHYDANGNGVRTDIQNINAANIPSKTISAENENAVDSANPTITHTQTFDVLDRLVSSSREISPTETATTSYQYDNNDNLTQITQPEGNLIKLEYDERNLLFKVTRGFGSADASTSTTNYDANGNVIQQVDGRGHVTNTQYDGFDRPNRITDHQGNFTTLAVDANSNVTRIENFNLATLRLTFKELVYDQLDRNFRSLRHLLDGSGNSTGTVKMAYFFDQNSRITRAEDDNNHGMDYVYDGANRLTRRTDALGNVQDYTYDGNSNLSQILETERDPETSQTQQFVTDYTFDVINRVKQSVYRSSDSSIIITNKFNYDSRNNTTFTLDAENNTITYEFDGINRLRKTLRDLRNSQGQVTSSITTEAAYDRNSRLTATKDGKGNQSTYQYDALDRQTRMTYPDAKFIQYTYDTDDNLARTVDPNGTQVDLTYDSLERLTNKTITRAAGVLGTTFENFAYDGLSRLTSASNDDSTVSMIYDSLSRVTSTTQNGKTISRLFDGVGNRLQLNYPGGRVVSYYPDELDRIKNIRAGAYSPSSSDPIISAYKYVGFGRVKERSYLNGTNLAVTYDGVKRIADYTNSLLALPISQYQYSYDRMFNKLFEKRIHHSKRDDYKYDSVYRLVEQKKDADLNGNNPVKTIDYALDDAGNRTQVTENGTPTSYTVNNLNQYTAVGTATQTHDSNGNLVNDTARAFSYDYANRLVKVAGTQTVEYKYDVFGRRVEKILNSTVMTRYFYEGARVIEDRTGADAVDATYVYGNGIDEILTMERGGQTYYFHSNSMGSITEITNSLGQIVERYEYDVYGKVTIFTGPGLDTFWHTSDDAVSATSAIGNRYMYTGRELEPETGLYHYRARFYDPLTGRFLSHDPIGPDGLGSLYAYVSNSPAVYVDPMGEEELIEDEKGRIVARILMGGKDVKLSIYGVTDKTPHTSFIVPRKDVGKWADFVNKANDRGYNPLELAMAYEFSGLSNPMLQAKVNKVIGKYAASFGGGDGIDLVGVVTHKDDYKEAGRYWEQSGFWGKLLAGTAILIYIVDDALTLASFGSKKVVQGAAEQGVRKLFVRTATELGETTLKNVGRRAPEFVGGKITESGFLKSSVEFLGVGYKEVSPGRFVSADGVRQVRLGKHETAGRTLHAHFEAYDKPAIQGGRVIENTKVEILPDK